MRWILITEGIIPVDHGNLNVWVRSSVVNLKTNVQSYQTKKAIREAKTFLKSTRPNRAKIPVREMMVLVATG